MQFEQVFNNLILKHMDAFRKQIQSLVDFVLNHRFGHMQCKQSFTRIARIKFL